MSSGVLRIPQNTGLYMWNDKLDISDYLFARYHVTSCFGGVETAIGMAMEQSVGTTAIHNYLNSASLETSCIRVHEVCELSSQTAGQVPTYVLSTPVYAGDNIQKQATFKIVLAFPLRLFASKPAQLWNLLVGELPRLGFISSFSLLDAKLPVGFGPGPAFGVKGIRQLVQQSQRPLLCRSTRPAVGLDIETMAKLNRDVLIGGFHIVKDDELMVFGDFHDFELHIRAMLVARNTAIEVSGEKKLYFANLICEPWELQERWELCCELGVDGVLIAPWIQGLGTLSYLARQKRMPILAHNTLGELFTRHPDWKIDEVLANHWLRSLGADMIVTTGGFPSDSSDHQHNSHSLSTIIADDENRIPALPILQGGKNPIDLPHYRAAVGSDDFMLIVAHWVDNYPDGLIAGAREFRNSL